MLQCYSRTLARTKGRKAVHGKQAGPPVCHTDTSGKLAPVQDGHYGAPEETHRGLQRKRGGTSLFRGIFKETSRVKVGSRNSAQHQSRLRLQKKKKKMKEEKNNHVSRHQQACIMGMWKQLQVPVHAEKEAAELMLHESLSLGCYRDISLYHITTKEVISQSIRPQRVGGAGDVVTCPRVRQRKIIASDALMP